MIAVVKTSYMIVVNLKKKKKNQNSEIVTFFDSMMVSLLGILNVSFYFYSINKKSYNYPWKINIFFRS